MRPHCEAGNGLAARERRSDVVPGPEGLSADMQISKGQSSERARKGFLGQELCKDEKGCARQPGVGARKLDCSYSIHVRMQRIEKCTTNLLCGSRG